MKDGRKKTALICRFEPVPFMQEKRTGKGDYHMKKTITELNKSIDAYNQEAEAAHLKSVTYGSMQRPRVTLSSLINDHSNDNNPTKGG